MLKPPLHTDGGVRGCSGMRPVRRYYSVTATDTVTPMMDPTTSHNHPKNITTTTPELPAKVENYVPEPEPSILADFTVSTPSDVTNYTYYSTCAARQTKSMSAWRVTPSVRICYMSSPLERVQPHYSNLSRTPQHRARLVCCTVQL
jgi:hypothetical protein